MSVEAQQYRDAMKAKAQRMATGDPHQKVDASSWTPGEAMNADSQTGERPISRRQYKVGGAVAAPNAGRAPRASGGKALTANSYVNRDVRKANEEREGIKHVGGFAYGGSVGARTGNKSGPDVLSMLSPAYAISQGKLPAGGGLASLIGKSKGGSLTLDGSIQGTRPTGGRLARASGGKTGKGKMNVNIVINTKPDADAAPPMPMTPPPMPMPPPAMMKPPGPPMPPPGAPPPMGMPPGGAPPMGRKMGGSVSTNAKPDGASGGGIGRLEKIGLQRKAARK